jgi:hypothetical protein
MICGEETLVLEADVGRFRENIPEAAGTVI